MLALTSRPIHLAAKSSSKRTVCVPHAQRKSSGSSTGYVEADNSNRGNIFPVPTKSFYSSPTSEQAARQGLGGAQGGVVLAGVIALVGLATVTVAFQGTGETLTQVQASDLESLTVIANRIAASI